jgi:hypothetical protein
MKPTLDNFARESRFAKSLYGDLPKPVLKALRELTQRHQVSVRNGDVKYLDGGWYITLAGLLGVAERRHCAGIHCHLVPESSDPARSRWVFRATVFKSARCRGFSAYGDADFSNIPRNMQGALLRIAQSRAIARALRTAYGVACSAEEIASFACQQASSAESKKPPQTANGNGSHDSPKVRDRLCQIIRQHQLDPNLVKSYAVSYCNVRTLREATRDQVENFVAHLADWAEKDRNALLCQLNSYPSQKEEGAA